VDCNLTNTSFVVFLETMSLVFFSLQCPMWSKGTHLSPQGTGWDPIPPGSAKNKPKSQQKPKINNQLIIIKYFKIQNMKQLFVYLLSFVEAFGDNSLIYTKRVQYKNKKSIKRKSKKFTMEELWTKISFYYQSKLGIYQPRDFIGFKLNSIMKTLC